MWTKFPSPIPRPIPRAPTAPSRRRKSLPNRDATKGGAPSCAERVVGSLVDIISHLAGRTAAAAARVSAVARWRRARAVALETLVRRAYRKCASLRIADATHLRAFG